MSAEVIQFELFERKSAVLYDGAPWPDVPWPGGIDDLEWEW